MKLLSDLEQQPEPRSNLRVVGWVVNPCLRLCVGKRGSRFDDCLAVMRVDNFCFWCHLPEHRKREPFHVADQRTDVCGQQTRQHVSPPFNEIDRGASFGGLPVYCRIGVHKVSHVGDVHTNPVVSVRQSFAGNCVVNILTARRIHRARANSSQVFAAGAILRAGSPISRRKTSQHCLGELARDDPVLVQDYSTLDIAVANVAKNRCPMPSWVMAVPVPPIENNNDALILKVGRMPCLDCDVRDSSIGGNEDAVGLAESSRSVLSFPLCMQWSQSSSILAPVALDDANNAAFRFATHHGKRFR
mmetsp:Transcript_20648/g.39183  ORF Transcript_20648/g.39183 Transcript_20648/m.39183 type:complete len:302 (+) Transcript_20648:998-1903(+)